MGGSSSSKGKFRTLITLQGFSTGAQADTIGLKRPHAAAAVKRTIHHGTSAGRGDCDAGAGIDAA